MCRRCRSSLGQASISAPQIGYAWGTSNLNVTDGFGDFVSFHSSNSGVIGGGHVGYNLQFNQFVVGLEGDVDGTSLSKTISGSPFIEDLGSVPVTVSAKADIMGSIRGRVGYAWDRVLIYATGGVAFAGIEGTIYGPFGGQVSSSTTRVGWTFSAAVLNMPLPTTGRSAPNIGMHSSAIPALPPTTPSQLPAWPRSALSPVARPT